MGEARGLALVTGASSGIGYGVASTLVEHGWAVVGVARRADDCPADLASRCRIDLGDLAALERWGAAAVAPLLRQRKWRCVGLVNNAAQLGAMSPLADQSPAGVADLLAVNTVAPMYLMGLVSREVPRTTPLRVVNISSAAAGQGYPGLGDYCASKAALRVAGMAQVAEWEWGDLARSDAALLSYEPGVVDTDMQRVAREADPHAFPSHAAFADFFAQQQLLSPGQVAAPVVDFLERDEVRGFVEERYGEEET